MISKRFILIILIAGFTTVRAQTTIEYDVVIDTLKSDGQSELSVATFLPKNKNFGIRFTEEISDIGNFNGRVYYHFNDCAIIVDSIKFKTNNLSQKQKDLIFEFMKNWLMTANMVFYHKDEKIQCQELGKIINNRKLVISIAQSS